MDRLTNLFATHQEVIMQYRYVILFVVATFEGTATMLAAGTLAALGVFSVPLAFGICIVAEILDGFLWYGIGYWGGAKPIDWLTRKSPTKRALIDKIRHHSDKAAGLIVLLVKLTYSITTPTLVLIGSLKYNIKKYAFFNVIGSIGWVAMLFPLGFYFGNLALSYLPAFRTVGIVVFYGIVAFIALLLIRELGGYFIRRVRQAAE